MSMDRNRDLGGPADSDWPAIAWESHRWRSAVDTSSLPPSVRETLRDGRYQSAVTPDIAHAPVALSPMLSTLVTDASVEIARFDAEVGHEINHFSAVLLRTESVVSSRIENLSASARAVADAELTGTGGGNATLIVANTKAMTAAVGLSDRLDADAILAMHQALLGDSDPKIAGKWRTDQVWIGGATSARTRPCSFRHTMTECSRRSTTSSSSWRGTTRRPWRRRPSLTRSS